MFSGKPESVDCLAISGAPRTFQILTSLEYLREQGTGREWAGLFGELKEALPLVGKELSCTSHCPAVDQRGQVMSSLKLEVYESGVGGHSQQTVKKIPILGRKPLPYFASDIVWPQDPRESCQCGAEGKSGFHKFPEPM